jgi:hypothetical protein
MSEKMSEETSEKMSEKMSEKIMSIIKDNPLVTIDELSTLLNKTTRTIERNLSKPESTPISQFVTIQPFFLHLTNKYLPLPPKLEH